MEKAKIIKNGNVNLEMTVLESTLPIIEEHKMLTPLEIIVKHHPDTKGILAMLDEYSAQQNRINILNCVKIVERAFSDQHKTLGSRSPEDQNILGNCITVLESDIKNQMKKLI